MNFKNCLKKKIKISKLLLHFKERTGNSALPSVSSRKKLLNRFKNLWVITKYNFLTNRWNKEYVSYSWWMSRFSYSYNNVTLNNEWERRVGLQLTHWKLLIARSPSYLQSVMVFHMWNYLYCHVSHSRNKVEISRN